MVKRYSDRESRKSPYFLKSQIRHSGLTHRYTRPRGKQPDYTAPVVLRNGKNTVRHFCDAIHKNIVPNFKNGEFPFFSFLLHRLPYHLLVLASSSLPVIASPLYHSNLHHQPFQGSWLAFVPRKIYDMKLKPRSYGLGWIRKACSRTASRA